MDLGTHAMTFPQFIIRSQRFADAAAINALHAQAFGPGRFARSAYRVREQGGVDLDLSLTAWNGGELAGVIHFTRIEIGGRSGALLLGPLAVAPELHGQGWGTKLICEGVARATAEGFRLVVLVGDVSYYGKQGFQKIPCGQIVLPGPVDPNRMLAAELYLGSLKDYAGPVRGIT
jgi:predicted N-acetyltransferase YhbS